MAKPFRNLIQQLSPDRRVRIERLKRQILESMQPDESGAGLDASPPVEPQDRSTCGGT